MNFQKVIQFIKYHNAFTIAFVLVFVFSASVFASPAVREAVLGKTTIEQEGIDNSFLLSVDLDNFNFKIKIDNVSQDEENYYVDYTYESLGIKENVWQKVTRAETITISKSALAGKDLGLYITKELGEVVDSELAYLKDVQEKQKQRGQTFVQETTKYTGMIGLVLDSSTKVLSGYEPVVRPTKHEPVAYEETTPPENNEGEGENKENAEQNVVIYYYDGDGDGYGYYANMQSNCPQPEGYVTNKGDCNDLVFNINPGVAEICDDGLDNDCDGKIDLADEDCQTASPDSPELVCNATHLDLCLTEADCVRAQGYWYNEICNSEAEITEEPEEPEEPEDIYGCTDATALNYDLAANVDDGSCEYPEPELPEEGAIDTTTPLAEPEAILGCMDATALNYNPDATEDDGSCEYAVKGCMDAEAMNYSVDATQDDGSCEYAVKGCMDAEAMNYSVDATQDDGSCEYAVMGCTDLEALNYNPDANTDDGSCTYNIYGCTDATALNYDLAANVDDGSCEYPEPDLPDDDAVDTTTPPVE